MQNFFHRLTLSTSEHRFFLGSAYGLERAGIIGTLGDDRLLVFMGDGQTGACRAAV